MSVHAFRTIIKPNDRQLITFPWKSNDLSNFGIANVRFSPSPNFDDLLTSTDLHSEKCMSLYTSKCRTHQDRHFEWSCVWLSFVVLEIGQFSFPLPPILSSKNCCGSKQCMNFKVIFSEICKKSQRPPTLAWLGGVPWTHYRWVDFYSSQSHFFQKYGFCPLGNCQHI